MKDKNFCVYCKTEIPLVDTCPSCGQSVFDEQNIDWKSKYLNLKQEYDLLYKRAYHSYKNY